MKLDSNTQNLFLPSDPKPPKNANHYKFILKYYFNLIERNIIYPGMIVVCPCCLDFRVKESQIVLDAIGLYLSLKFFPTSED